MKKERFLINAPFELVKPNIKRILDIGLGVEIYLDNNLLDQIEEGEITDLSRMLKENGISCTCHGPYMDLSPGAVDNRIREVTVDRFKKALDVAGKLEASNLIFHSGYERWHFDSKIEIWFENSLRTWEEVLKGKDELPRVLIENVFEEDPEPLLELLKFFKDRLFFCFDTGHFNVYSNRSIDYWMEKLGRWIKEFHLHDNFGRDDDHLPIGSGNFPFMDLKSLIVSLTDPQILYVIEPLEEEKVEESIRALFQFFF